ncbi:nickel pincer cofactor biosynthesis protein LarC [Peptoniphilus sp. BV3AC2]|uniref:nickel pincer cofactor biosynthesis protein LarC n=1 Tax=Peptoniphilus sp. BV3AC2 TaxID=1111133 RepID=UPI0003B7FDFA|nr:nickel pincer cofactor biosynthesis protein LarC [Peptoniphilus sp. BV3AC2]ERT63458.1 TIGR00299 family protein [Peptoniphilus sp. BV3AC2]
MDLLLECYSGISGNMFIGALLDLGVPFEYLKNEIDKLNIHGYELVYKKVDKLGIDSTYFNVKLLEDEHHTHEHCHNHEHNDDLNEDKHDHGDEHEHSHHHEHDQDNHEHHHSHVHRNLNDINTIINGSDLSDYVKENSLKIFEYIARAESKIHGKSIDEVHFHEVGAIDSIIDAVGASVCLEYLKVNTMYASNIYKGHGFVNCAHGLFPVPAPATLEILNETSFELKQSVVESELITPTGAALLATFAKPLMSPYKSIKTSYGAGTKDFEIPNVLRISEIELKENKNKKTNEIFLLETNLDDITGEDLGFFMELCMNEGALDVFYTPIYMKKNRPAYKLSVITKRTNVKSMAKLIFKHTTSIGVRFTKYRRFEMDRTFENVETKYGKVTKKILKYEDIKKESYEYEDLKKIATENNISIEEVRSNLK